MLMVIVSLTAGQRCHDAALIAGSPLLTIAQTNDGCRFFCYCLCDFSLLCDMWWCHSWPVLPPEDTSQDRGHCGPGEEARGDQDPGCPGHLQLQVSICHHWPGLCVHLVHGRIAEVNYDTRHLNIVSNRACFSIKSVCQVVEEEIVGVISLRGEEPLTSLCYTLGIPLLVLHSSTSHDSALSSLINLSPASEMVGKALTDVIRAKSWINSVMVYKNQNDFFLLKNILQQLDNFNGGFKLLEVKNSSTLAEKLSLGSVHCCRMII